MSIKRRLYLSVIFSILIGLIIFVIVIIASQRVDKVSQQYSFALEASNGLFDLNILTYEYLFRSEDRMRDQWYSKFEKLSSGIKSSDSKKLKNLIVSELNSLIKTFSQVVDINKEAALLIKQKKPIKEIKVIMSLRDRLVGQLLIKSQSISANVHNYADEAFDSANDIRKKTNRLVLGLILVLVVLISISSILTAQRIAAPLEQLTEAAQILGRGNLKHKIIIKTKDELGQLASTFNKMAEELSESYERLEDKVRERTIELEKANLELDSFVYTASHDLRAPLRGIESFATFVEEAYAPKLDETGKNYLSRIKKAAQRMKELIEDLLTLSRISRIRNPFTDVNTNELIKDVLGRLEYDLDTMHVKIEVVPKMPTIYCDKIKMAEVFLNLINNSIKYSSKIKDRCPKIKIGYNDEDKMHQFFVKDNGIGIPKEYYQKIFGIFQKLHNQEEYGGSGAGLSIVKRIIDDHNGKIWVDSEIGSGSTFYFEIPKKEILQNKEESENGRT